MKWKDGEVTFETTGRTHHAVLGIIGISPDGDVTHGFDGGFPYSVFEMTAAERAELADHMIERWQRFKEQGR